MDNAGRIVRLDRHCRAVLNTISDQALSAAAATSTSARACLEAVGLPYTPKRARNLRARLTRLGLDVSSWTGTRHLYSSDDLAAAVASSASVSETMRRLGIPLAGGSHAYLANRIRREGMDTSHFLGQASQRGRVSPRRLQPHEVLTVRPPGSRRVSAPQLVRAMLALGLAHECAHCGLGPLRQQPPLTLVVDHVNGDWLDNRPENVRFLCPNCHAQTSTWCRKLSARTSQRRPDA